MYEITETASEGNIYIYVGNYQDMKNTILPSHKTHIFSQKMWPKFDLCLMRWG